MIVVSNTEYKMIVRLRKSMNTMLMRIALTDKEVRTLNKLVTKKIATVKVASYSKIATTWTLI